MKSYFITLLASAILCGAAMAAAPNLVSYQGRLTDAAGNPIANGSYSVTFAIYNISSGGSALWTETQSVTASGGLFSVLLGLSTPFGTALFADTTRYLGIRVGTDPELSPRTRLSSVPFALSAASAGGWQDDGTAVRLNTSTDYVGIGTTTPVHSLEVVDASGGLFPARFEGSNPIASALENSNTSNGATWEFGVAGSAGAFGGTAPSGSMYFNRQGSSLPGLVIDSNGTVGVGCPPGISPSRMIVRKTGADYGPLAGVSGVCENSVGASEGVVGEARGADQNLAVYGLASNGTKAYGILGEAEYSSQEAFGVYGRAYANGAIVQGVRGEGTGSGSYGGYFSGEYIGVQGQGGLIAGYFSKGSPGGVTMTSSPVAVIENSTNAYVAINSPNASERGILFGQPSQEAAGGVIYNTPSVPNGLNFRTSNNTIKMVITDVGNVGIGTTSPGAGLHVKGAGFPRAFGYFDTDASTQDAGLRFYEAGVAKSHVYHQASTNTLNLYGEGYSGISVNSTGSVGIGTTSPTAKLHVVGNICYTGSIGACSDARYKTDVSGLTHSLNKLLQLRGVSYRWKKDEYPTQNFDDHIHIGFIAQEVEQLYPEMVMTDSAGYKSVDYGRLTPVLVEAIKEQQKTIESMAAKLQMLETKINQLVNVSAGGSTHLSQK